MPTDVSQIMDNIIRTRATRKVFANPAEPLPAECDRAVIEELISVAGWAPFHHFAGDGRVPWRFHVLDAAACRHVGQSLCADGDTTKVPKMMAAATALVLAAWCPEGECKPAPRVRFEANLKNMEHIAATSAAIQNLLLAATARGLNTYWCSGGALSEEKELRKLGIPETEILLGAVFLFPGEIPPGLETVTGKNRESRGPLQQWMRCVE